MEIPGNVIIDLGRRQLRQNPGIHEFVMPWHHDDGYTVMVEVSVEALLCKDRAHPPGAWWKVEGRHLTPVPKCPQCLRMKDQSVMDAYERGKWLIDMDYAERAWTNIDQ